MNYYELLEVSPNASIEVIRASYKAMAKKYHPDVYGDGGKMMKCINDAFQVLSDDSKRKEYDEKLLTNSTKEECNEKEESSDNNPLSLSDWILGIVGLIIQGIVAIVEFVWGIIIILIIIGFFTGHTQILFSHLFYKILSFIK